MGSFIVNFHVRSTSFKHVKAALKRMTDSTAYVSTARRGWISLYEERASTQDEEFIHELAAELSTELKTAVIAFLVHDSDIFRYWLYEQGRLLDEYNSKPDYFSPATPEAKEKFRGKPEVLQPFLAKGTALESVRSALDESSVFAEDKLEGLAKLLGVDTMRARLDYQDFARGEVEPSDVKVKYVGSLSADGQATDQPQADENSPKTLAELMLPQIRKLMKTKPQTALVMALSAGLHEEAREALASGANVNDPDPLYGETPLAAAISAGMIETVKALLKLGADVTKACASGSSLHVAVGTGNLAVVGLLLESGADPNYRGKLGVTPLMIASGMGGGIFGSTELVDLLLQRGADFHAKDDAGGTALDMSAHAVAMLETSLAQSDHAAAETDSFRQMLDRVLKVREFLQAYEKAHTKPETL